MTAHRAKPTITPERIDWFARYHLVELAWGVFHVALDDGNYTLGAAGRDRWDEAAGRWVVDPAARADWPADVRDAAEWFDSLTPSQRRRLGLKAEARTRELQQIRR